MKLSEKFRVRCLLAFVVLAALASFAIAAVTSHTLVRKNDDAIWTVSAYSADATGAELLKAAPGAGLYLYVTKMIVIADAGVTVTIGEDESSSAPVTVYFTIPGGGTGTTFDFREYPVRIGDANSQFVMDANTAGDVYVFAEGFTDTAN